MDITNASMTSLLKEPLTPQPVPSARPDPATAALVKAIVQPPAPAMVQSAQFAAQALNGSLAKPPAQSSQRLSSAEIENAYRAVMEPDAGTNDTSARRPTAHADQPSRAVPLVQSPAGDGAAKVAAAPPPSSFSPAVASAVLVAANANAPQPRGAAARPAGHAPRSEPGQVSLWTISVVTAIVSAATATIVLLLLR
ncbi:hypothetical protein RFM26_26185 [Mesorhizobium sp. VK23B]|uniref:Uncharacterized protein n=1 Tax=Mesorhizobium dulcispinae TaxID=3072316 RepID=A0ABU4XLA2_9HYPH|nr:MULTISPECIES: hypothetical protein [unclassified Mesorhizobium]MDX8469192.1 hypothetical protein [Mesorhizobium sp. VK23B]MDX8475530.1 hypothetical protein [Mesorhizobium sp. VK23A]